MLVENVVHVYAIIPDPAVSLDAQTWCENTPLSCRVTCLITAAALTHGRACSRQTQSGLRISFKLRLCDSACNMLLQPTNTCGGRASCLVIFCRTFYDFPQLPSLRNRASVVGAVHRCAPPLNDPVLEGHTIQRSCCAQDYLIL